MFLSTFGPNAVSCSIILWVIVPLSRSVWFSNSWLSSVSYSSLQCPRQSCNNQYRGERGRPPQPSPCGTPAHSWSWKVVHSASRASGGVWSCGSPGAPGWGNFYHRHCRSRPRRPSHSPPPSDSGAAGGWSHSPGSCSCRWRWRRRWRRPELSTGSPSRRTSPSPHCRSAPAPPGCFSPRPPPTSPARRTPPHLPPHFVIIFCKNIWTAETRLKYFPSWRGNF